MSGLRKEFALDNEKPLCAFPPMIHFPLCYRITKLGSPILHTTTRAEMPAMYV